MTSCLVCWKNIVFHINTRVFIWYVCFDLEVAQFFQGNTNKVLSYHRASCWPQYFTHRVRDWAISCRNACLKKRRKYEFTPLFIWTTQEQSADVKSLTQIYDCVFSNSNRNIFIKCSKTDPAIKYGTMVDCQRFLAHWQSALKSGPSVVIRMTYFIK